ncbi:MAG: peptidylprolyl isomerase [SAR86 cluster bacterium]|uniref:Peptidyl-prolyl cis-trans isomerase n=1 Tax=SAR86 cluster bacterium TaxID=2030880 RepID=A0A2A5AC82_9GAMM|nr:MAG: peptidylprolyl isomerase [SAR86 cluster bacterium]
MSRILNLLNLAPSLLLALSLTLASNAVFADAASAQLAMEDSQNPLMLINTSQGEVYLELFPGEAPLNTANFIGLAEGEVDIIEPESGISFTRRYFNGMRFHRVVPGFVIQGGSPAYNPFGAPAELLADEINADYLGLDTLAVLNADGSFNEMLNISSKQDFETEILKPLYLKMRIDTPADLLARQNEVLTQLQQLTVKTAYENQGYRYSPANSSRKVSRGVIAMANSGPDSNGPEFFISLEDADWLTGKHTVIGKVVEGMDVADTIGATAIDDSEFSRLSTMIYSIRRVN